MSFISGDLEMAYDQQLQQNDAIEAFKTFQAARSLFFWLLFLALIGLQGIFWTMHLGVLDQVLPFEPHLSNTELVYNTTESRSLTSWTNAHYQFIQQDSTNNDPAPNAQSEFENVKLINEFIKIALKGLNCLVLFTAILFSISLLIGLNISMIGQLGQIAFSTKAFFLSLVLCVLIFPWQTIVNPEIPGFLYTYEQLSSSYWYTIHNNYVDQTERLTNLGMYFIRYVGLWFLSMAILVTAQSKSIKAAKNIFNNVKSNLSAKPVIQPQQTAKPTPSATPHDDDPIPLD